MRQLGRFFLHARQGHAVEAFENLILACFFHVFVGCIVLADLRDNIQVFRVLKVEEDVDGAFAVPNTTGLATNDRKE